MRKRSINVLVACEESQAITSAFREAGFNAFSCDIQQCRKGLHKDWHIKGDVTPYLDGQTDFVTEDGKAHHLSHWHLIIAHPPCTYICKVSSVWMVIKGEVQQDRLEKMQEAVSFFHKCLEAKADYVAVENPLPMKRAGLPPPSCYIHPYWYGVKYSKKTLFWLRNLPPLVPTIENPNYKCFVTASRGKFRSRTFPQVAKAIAHQWGEFIKTDLENRMKHEAKQLKINQRKD